MGKRRSPSRNQKNLENQDELATRPPQNDMAHILALADLHSFSLHINMPVTLVDAIVTI
jgi:hypothetical protein